MASDLHPSPHIHSRVCADSHYENPIFTRICGNYTSFESHRKCKECSGARVLFNVAAEERDAVFLRRPEDLKKFPLNYLETD